jgi:hypothetical protein
VSTALTRCAVAQWVTRTPTLRRMHRISTVDQLHYNRRMALPEIVPVKYTEEEAEYVSIRPVVQQQFRGPELIDMIVSVTGKDLPRIQQILSAGTIVFHSYRYWWPALEADATELRGVLAKYPDADSSRPFRAEQCWEVTLESSGNLAAHSVRFRRADASKKKFLRTRSFWDCLMELSREIVPAYRDYSYAARADLYSSPLEREQVARLALEASRYGTRAIRPHLAALPSMSQIVYACPR